MNNSTKVHRRAIWAGITLLLVLTVIFMGRVLFPPADQTLGGADVRGAFVPWLTFVRDSLHEGRLPLWDPYQMSGYPFIGNPQVGLFYPPTWLSLVLPVSVGLGWGTALHVWLAGAGAFLLVRMLRGSWLAALLAALAYSFNGFTAVRLEAGQVGLLATHAWLPWLLLAFLWGVNRADVWSAMIAGIPPALTILAGHTPSLWIIALVWGGFILYMLFFPLHQDEGPRPDNRTRWLIIRQAAIMTGMGLCLSAVQLVPTLELGRLSYHTPTSSPEFSFPPAHLITLIVPEYFGGPPGVGYWSVPNFQELTYYVGMLPLLGLMLACRKPTRRTWLYVGLGAFGLLLALGSYGFLYPILSTLIPPLQSVRTPGRAAFLFVFAVSMGLADAISHWENMPDEERRATAGPYLRQLLIGIGLVGIAGLTATGAVLAILQPADTSGRLWHQIVGWALALFFALAGGALLWRYLITDRNRGGERRILATGLAVLLLADLWVFGFKLVQPGTLEPDPLWSEARQIIGQTDERVLPWGFPASAQNGAGQVGLRSVFSYNPLEVAATQSLANSVLDPRSTAFDLLGVGYVIAGSSLDEYTQGEHSIELVGNTDLTWVYRRARVLPVVRMVYETEIIGDADTAIGRVHEPNFDPATTVILGQQPPCDVGPVPQMPGETKVVEEQPGAWLIDVEGDAPGLLVLSETAYPGWKVTVDGQRAEVLTAYTAVRAVCVPAGVHRVEWTFDPVSHRLGAGVALFALVAVGFASVMTWRKARA